MRDLDRVITEILEEEDEAILRAAEEPGFLDLSVSAMRGPRAWVNWILMAAQAAMFVGGAYAAYRFFAASEVLAALRWGLPAATLLVLGLVTKMGVLPSVEAGRVVREVRRLELRVERLRDELTEGVRRGSKEDRS